ncbi:translation initiation factor IF-2 isoform X1 [Columba livia]|uniref:translation initiation factor IF-2 isoform X1 n=1 Tax=Columba livia TaxID=8932 RepID=UPI0031BA9ABB
MPPPAFAQPPHRPQVPPVSPHSRQVPPVAPRSPLSPRHASPPWTLRSRGATGASPDPPPREAAVPPAPPVHTRCPGRWVPVSTSGSPLRTRARPSADLRPPSPVSTATAQPPRRGPEARGLEEPRRCRSGLSSLWFAGRPWAGATTEASGQSGAVQHGGARGGGGGGGAEVPPSCGEDAGSAFPSLLRPPGRPGLALRRLRGRLVPALARRLLPGRQRPHLQLAPGADGDGHGGAVWRRKNGTTEYKLLPAEAVFANTLGLLIILFGVLVLGALARPSWKRPDTDSPESHQPLLTAER